MPARPVQCEIASPPRLAHVAGYFDGSRAARRALEEARRRLSAGGRLSVVHVDATLVSPVFSPEAVMWAWDPDEQRAALEAWLGDELEDVSGAVGVLLEGRPGEELCAWAREANPALIVTASDGVLGRLLRGGVVRALRRRAPCPVLVVDRRQAEDASPLHPALAS
jgi:nucleotide-binding universal stress UspA family protein